MSLNNDYQKSFKPLIIYFKNLLIMEKSLMSGRLRSVITLVDKLRDIKLQSYIKLPKIVAVGSQSSGKSSLVEQIVGIDFLPRGSGVVTRRPLQLRMIYQKDLVAPYGVFAQIPNKKFTKFNEVKDSIEMLTEKICGNNKNIVDNPIILDVYSAHCPNLTIIDLPGLTRIAIDGQDKNIHEVTTKMIRKYMQEPSTIILCVIPANQDITNDQVLYMARKIDQKGERTIGCITKIDIMDRGTDARCLLLNKGDVSLKLGYVGIKNRSQEDINNNKSVQQSIEDEKMFFSKSPIYSSLPPSAMGTSSLVNTMTTVLTQSIVKFIPELISHIKQRKNNLAAIVKQYGKPLPKSPQEKQSLLWQLCSQFINEYNKSLKGQISSLRCGDKVLKMSTRIQQQMLQTLEEQFNASPTQNLSDQKILLAIRKFDGDNMPGYPSIGSFLYLLHPLLQRLKYPIQQRLNAIHQELLAIINVLITEIAHQFVEFREHISSKVQTILYRYKKSSFQFMNNIIQSELGYIYTNDYTYDDYMNQKTKKQEQTKLAKEFPMIVLLRQRVNAYYRVVVKNLRDVIPKNIKYQLLIEATKKIQFQIFQTIGNTENHEEFLKVRDSTKNQRIKNQMEYDIICKAEQFLMTHASFGNYREAQAKKRLILRQKQIQQNQKKRSEREFKKKQEKKNFYTQQSQKKDDPKQKKQVQIQKKVKNDEKSGSLFQDFFGKKNQPKKEQPSSQPPSSVKKEQQNKEKQPVKTSFADIFGSNSKPEPPKQQQTNKKQDLQGVYNREAGKMTDNAVDNLYANKKFQDQSKKAVSNGTSIAAQKQLGVSQETGKTLGKGAGWLFGQDAVQNHLKQQTKKNVRAQTQFPNPNNKK